MLKLNFLIIGTQKGGTSALDYYLRLHPEIEMGKKKELHFFDDEEIFKSKKVDYTILESHFQVHSDTKICGEATPIYMYWQPCIKRIWEYNHKIKLIAILRNPISRAYSQWNMEIQRKWDSGTFLDCIINEEKKAKESLPLQHRVYSYIDRGFYSEQIRRIKRFFPEQQILFIKYEDFLSNQQLIVSKTINFLGLSPADYNFKHKEVHKRGYKKSITENEKSYLKEIYRNDIREVERLLDWDCSDWLV